MELGDLPHPFVVRDLEPSDFRKGGSLVPSVFLDIRFCHPEFRPDKISTYVTSWSSLF